MVESGCRLIDVRIGVDLIAVPNNKSTLNPVLQNTVIMAHGMRSFIPRPIGNDAVIRSFTNTWCSNDRNFFDNVRVAHSRSGE